MRVKIRVITSLFVILQTHHAMCISLGMQLLSQMIVNNMDSVIPPFINLTTGQCQTDLMQFYNDIRHGKMWASKSMFFFKNS